MNNILIEELGVKIKENIAEIEMIIELLSMPKYYNSKSLTERLEKKQAQTKKLIEEKTKMFKYRGLAV